MARAFILSPKYSDMSAISGSSSVSNASVIGLLRARPKLYWRSTEPTPYVEGNFGTPRVLDTLIQGFFNAREGDTFRLRLASSQANLTAAPIIDFGPQPMWPSGSDLSEYAKIHRVFTFEQQTAQWYRIDYDFSGNPDGFVQGSRVVIGKRIEPLTSVEAKWSMGGQEDVAETVDMGGEESPRVMGVKRSFTCTWHNLRESEREQLYVMKLERGSAKDVVLAVEPSEGPYSMARIHIGRIKDYFSFEQTMEALDPDNGPPVQHFTVSFKVQEAAPIEMR
jgi:hypothetical protein